MVSGLVATGMPPTSSVIVWPLTGRSVRLVSPAVTVTRSWLENDDRASDAAVTLTFVRSAAALTGTGVSSVPSGRRVPSSPRQPPR
ncbi:hypothetical protein D3C83_41840 [compost metagenome]